MSNLRSWLVIAACLLGGTAKATAQISPQIIGGSGAALGQFPWQAQISVQGQHVCGGALVHPQWVLTAAHCVYKHPVDVITVTLGGIDRTTSEPTEQVRGVIANIDHPGYLPGSYENDVLLLKLSSPVQLNPVVSVIPMATGDYDDGTMAKVSGYGWTMAGQPSSSEFLRFTELPLVSHQSVLRCWSR